MRYQVKLGKEFVQPCELKWWLVSQRDGRIVTIVGVESRDVARRIHVIHKELNQPQVVTLFHGTATDLAYHISGMKECVE